MPTNYEPLVLTIEPTYIGSAVSPTVDITETSDDVTVTITDFRGEHSYTVEKTDGAIADAEAAASNANAAAATAEAKGAQAVDIATTAAANADAKAALANTAATAANTAAGNADNAASDARAATVDTQAATSAANTATSNANAATSAANTAAQNADAKAALANTAASNADAKATLANTAASNADTKATLANNAATSATSAASDASTAASSANEAAANANTAATAADTAREAIQDDLAAKADKDGYYPLLSAGTSNALLSGDSTVGTFARRVSDHDGACRIESLLGNTVVWNQLINTIDTTESDGIKTGYDSETNRFFITNVSRTTNFGSGSGRGALDINLVQGHKYLVGGTGSIGIGVSSNSGFNNTNNIGTIFTAEYNIGSIMRISSQYDFVTAHPIGDTYYFTMMLFDLTLMFGAGNEPATVEEFEARFPDAYYQYDEGSLLSVNVEGIESASVTREIPAATYFPDGMRSAGSVYDELTSDKAVTRIGSVDLGTLNWGSVAAYDTAKYLMDTADLSAVIRKSTSATTMPFIECAVYAPNTVNNVYTMTKGISVTTSGRIRVYDDAYSTSSSASAFKAAMSGVMLFYELATPTTVDIDPPINMDYLTQQGGVESIVIPTGEMSAPPTLVTVYAYDADGIVDKSQSIVAPVEGARASANYSVGSYLVHDGTLYRVTTAIATGEVINPGSNVTATTVMAEIIRLTA